MTPTPDPPPGHDLAQAVGVGPECERVQLPLILDLAGALEEGGGVRRCQATGAQKQNPGHFGLGLGRVLQEDAGVIARGRDGVQMGVVHLQHQELDVRVFPNSINRDTHETRYIEPGYNVFL